MRNDIYQAAVSYQNRGKEMTNPRGDTYVHKGDDRSLFLATSSDVREAKLSIRVKTEKSAFVSMADIVKLISREIGCPEDLSAFHARIESQEVGNGAVFTGLDVKWSE